MTQPLSNLQARDLDAVLHPYSPLHKLREIGPTIMASGNGVFIQDTQGKEYIEGMSGLWCAGLGFGNEEMIEAAEKQLRSLPYYHQFGGRGTEPAIELAEKLKELAPTPQSKVFYTSSGSEANDTQVKLAWYYNNALGRPKKKKIISRIKAYHGVTMMAASLTGLPYNHMEFDLPFDGVLHTECPHYYRFGQEGESEEEFVARLAASLEAMIEREGGDTIAAMIAEPVMGAGGVIPPSAGYFQAIQPILQKHGIPLISDEVICGFGRTGQTWGCETYDFMPDAIISSKNLTAGYFPMGAVILGDALTDRLQAAAEAIEEFPHGFTASGHPVGCAIALKAIDVVMNEGLIDNVRALTPLFEEGLARMAEKKNIGEWRGKGLMGAVEAVADKDSKTPFDGSLSVSERIANACTDQGLICRPLGQAVVLCPAFIMTPAQMDEMFGKLDKALDQVFAEVG